MALDGSKPESSGSKLLHELRESPFALKAVFVTQHHYSSQSAMKGQPQVAQGTVSSLKLTPKGIGPRLRGWSSQSSG